MKVPSFRPFIILINNQPLSVVTILSPCPSSPHKYPCSCGCIETQEVNHLWENKVGDWWPFNFLWPLFFGEERGGLCCKRNLTGPKRLRAWIKYSFIIRKMGDTEGCGGILLLIRLECSTGVSKLSAFLSSHYCPAISATSCRCWKFHSCFPTIQSSLEKIKKMFHLTQIRYGKVLKITF